MNKMEDYGYWTSMNFNPIYILVTIILNINILMLLENSQLNKKKITQEAMEDGESSDVFCKLSSEKVAELHESKLKMASFINTVGNGVKIEKTNPIYTYCQKFDDLQITADQIMKMLNQRIEKMMKNQKVKKNWGKEDVQILVWTLINYMEIQKLNSVDHLTQNHWKEVSELIPGTTGNSCMFKLLNLKKIRISEKKWTNQEERILNQLVNCQKKQKKINWRIISQQLFLLNQEAQKIFRTAKQCKEHWASFLNEEMKKGPWHYTEDLQMLEFISKNNGKTKWAEMAKKICSRTENALKNRYNLIIKQQKKFHPEATQFQLIRIHLEKLYSKNTSRSKIEQTPEKKVPEDQIFQESEEKYQELQKTDIKKDEGKEDKNNMMFISLQNGAMCPMLYPTFIMFSGNMFSNENKE